MLSHTLRVRPSGKRDHLSAKELDEFLYRLALLGPLGAIDVLGKVAMRGRVIEMWATVPEDEAETARQIEHMAAEVTVQPHEREADLMPGYGDGRDPTLEIPAGAVRSPARAVLDSPRHRRT